MKKRLFTKWLMTWVATMLAANAIIFTAPEGDLSLWWVVLVYGVLFVMTVVTLLVHAA